MTTSPRCRRPTSGDDLIEGWEQVRRSVSLLGPGAWAFKREQALQLLDALVAELRRRRAD
ncbi:MAG: hypothetical protein ACFCVK_02510 [Acidimicrobiales bacterium]